ncbi:MAG: hypothetical protein IT410_04100 [Candidatus Doudnabacteria bacterium]|nr:hypothetical protein [Candidatus Doudnabacteria bacterium]
MPRIHSANCRFCGYPNDVTGMARGYKFRCDYCNGKTPVPKYVSVMKVSKKYKKKK